LNQGKKMFEDDNSTFSTRQANIKKAVKCLSLSQLKDEASACISCSLHQTRKNIVFSNVADRKDIMFIGEAPGATEDETGLPFTGMAGKLLERALSALKISYNDVYICNILKCRPPQNREPSEEETLKCTPWLERQIQLVEPKVIVCLGKHSASYIFEENGPMSSMRNKTKMVCGIPAIATWHPAFLLRREDKKDEFWLDLKRAMEIITSSNFNETKNARISSSK
jgi:uracil-DNA glycosylase family 4